MIKTGEKTPKEYDICYGHLLSISIFLLETQTALSLSLYSNQAQ